MVRIALWLLLATVAQCARAAPGVILEAELEPARVYVGAQALLKLRVLRAGGASSGSLRPPDLGAAGDLSLLRFRVFEVERSGTVYQVFERTNVVVPRRAGRLVIPGAEFESAEYLTERFDRGEGQTRILHGPQRVLEVLPAPANASQPFLPARALTLEESWSRDPDALSAGEPVTRTLVLRAEGLSAERLPQLDTGGSPILRVHQDQPELLTEYLDSGMIGQRVQRTVLMPLEAGAVVLPELRVRWWDVGADAQRVTTLPARTLRLHSVIAPPALPEKAAQIVSPTTALRALGTILLALTGAALWLYLRGMAQRDARARLRAACRRNDARAARDALLEWWRAARPDEPAPLPQQMAAEWNADARAAMTALDAALYGDHSWDGRTVWRALRPRLRRRRTRRKALQAPPRSPLFKLQALR
jgi:hypothetical protein